jgi:type IV secretory pathway VirB2 component (pilin)
MPCSAIRASILALAFGAAVARVSEDEETSSGSEKPLEEVRRVLDAGVPRVVPFGP